ncbi:MAG: Ldh family oxidoreductase, partial [Rhodospirillaceae bacterium]|nr:Ldh family oxidoreductase [Rhodospirillaceae bacterium]
MINKFLKTELARFAKDVFINSGVSVEHAEVWAEVLVWANLRGVDSHGVLRLPVYAKHLEIGVINPAPKIKIDPLEGAIARLDADLGPGPVAMDAAMKQAITKAQQFNLGWCAVANMTHAGAVGYYALQAAEAGFAGIIMTASQPMMAYAGTTIPAVSTNPIAIAVPGQDHPPLLLDMSTSTVGMGKIYQAQDSGQKIPETWGLDQSGQPTSDPNEVTVLQPLGGAKGSSLSLMIECLTSLAVNNPLVEPVLRQGHDLDGRPINGLALAVDIGMFGDIKTYRAQIDALAEQITDLPKADGVDNIYA